MCERPLREITANLRETDAPISLRKGPEPPIRHRLPDITWVDVTRPVTLTREGEHRVRANPQIAGDLLREVNTEKGKGRIGDWIHESADETSGRLPQRVVPTAERKDRKSVV